MAMLRCCLCIRSGQLGVVAPGSPKKSRELKVGSIAVIILIWRRRSLVWLAIHSEFSLLLGRRRYQSSLVPDGEVSALTGLGSAVPTTVFGVASFEGDFGRT